jgi:sugar lactone lactonase YvrE
VGTVVRLRSFDAAAGELPEGLTVDKRGHVYVSMTFIGQLRRIDRDGSEHLVTTLPTGNGFGPLGLAVDARGTVYAGVATLDPATQGVYRVTADGTATRLPGPAGIGIANGLAYDKRGTLYVTDSMNGLIWRIPRGGTAEVWLDSPLLHGDGSGPLPFPLGANGIVYRHGTLYVTNTELATIVAVPVLPDGSPGVPTVLAHDARLGGADGITADVHGQLYVAVIAQSTIVRVAADGSTITTLADAGDGLDYASSIAFGTSHGERKTLFAVNFSVGPFFGDVRTSGPALLAVQTGVPGLPLP